MTSHVNAASRAPLLQGSACLLLFLLCVSPAPRCRAQQHGPRPAAFRGSLYAAPQPTPDEEEEDVKPGRPGVANPAEIQKPGVLQLEAGYDSNFRAEEVRDEQTLQLALRYAATKRLLVEVGLDAVRSETDAGTRRRQTSVGDTRLGLQVVALEEADGRPALAFAYYVKAPTAREGLGTGRFDHKFVALLSKKAGGADIDFNVAYLLVGKEGESGREHGGQAALAVSRDFHKHFAFEAELSGQSHDDVQPRGLFALGTLRYKAGRRLQLDGGARFGLMPEAPRFGLFAGLTVGLTSPREK